jgi:hypothetical protein
MIHHFSFAARDPKHVAEVIAVILGGEAQPFPPVAVGSWMAMSGDAYGTGIEVYPLGAELAPAEGDADSIAITNDSPTFYVATHAAVGTALSEVEVHAIAAREGWISKYRKRGGRFGVIEFWIENRFMIEVLTAEMQAEYLETATPEAWRAMLAAGRPQAA